MSTIEKRKVQDKEYKVCNGTFYHKNTLDEVILVLETARLNDTRVVLDYGYTFEEHPERKDLGKSWGDMYDVTGRVGRSTGEIKVPILVYNTRALGGCAMLSECIVSIKTSAGKRSLYAHPNYKPYEN